MTTDVALMTTTDDDNGRHRCQRTLPSPMATGVALGGPKALMATPPKALMATGVALGGPKALISTDVALGGPKALMTTDVIDDNGRRRRR